MVHDTRRAVWQPKDPVWLDRVRFGNIQLDNEERAAITALPKDRQYVKPAFAPD
jgi:hypothetical protein